MINKKLLKDSASELGVSLDSRMLDSFDLYAEFLVEYNKSVNLTAITEPDEIVIKHFCDSLALLSKIDFPHSARLADVGAGPGFPSVPLLIARPDLELTIVEATKKKLDFIALLLEKLGLQAELLHMRAEEAGRLESYREQFDIVTARAVAKLSDLSEYCIPLVKREGIFLALKGRLSEDEFDTSKKAISVLGGKVNKVTAYTLSNGDLRTLVSVNKIKQTPSKYPRATAQIAKNPIK